MFSLIPGMGQMYNKQYGKGALFFLFGVSFFIVFYDLFNIGFWGLFTLGTMLPRDNSVFLFGKRDYCAVNSWFWYRLLRTHDA